MKRRAVRVYADTSVFGGVFDEEVAIEEDGLGACEDRIGSVEVIPAGLDHADVGVGKVLDGIGQKIFGGDEIGIEDRDELAFGIRQGCFERPSFVAVAVIAMEVVDVMPRRGEFLTEGGGDLRGCVCRVVKDLDIKH